MIDCPHWRDIGKWYMGECAISAGGKRPSVGFCNNVCKQRPGLVQITRKKLPGDVVEIVLKRMGYTSSGGCGCARFRKQMNDWGWAGCTMHVVEIAEWFQAKAREQSIPITVKTLATFFREAWREVRGE